MGVNAVKFEAWCILDLFGHQRTAGYVTEATIGGCAFIRIDVPQRDGTSRTEFYGNGAIYSMRPVSEEIARRIALKSSPVINAWDVQRLGLNPKPIDGEFGDPEVEDRRPRTIIWTDEVRQAIKDFKSGILFFEIDEGVERRVTSMYSNDGGDGLFIELDYLDAESFDVKVSELTRRQPPDPNATETTQEVHPE